jgi:hypothetical protein
MSPIRLESSGDDGAVMKSFVAQTVSLRPSLNALQSAQANSLRYKS